MNYVLEPGIPAGLGRAAGHHDGMSAVLPHTELTALGRLKTKHETTLLRRTKRGVELTEEGAAFLASRPTNTS
jgi:hypothetical protein